MAVLAIDQGTTGTRTILFNDAGEPVRRAYREFSQIFPKPGWVEHDPLEIWRTVQETIAEVCADLPEPVAAVGITNQRETTVLWDARTGQPVHNAIVWQCRRTTEICRDLADHEPFVRDRTGLPLDPYFSATKIRWLLDNVPEARAPDVRFGTIDSWVLWNLTAGRVHATDATNASRTLLLDIHRKQWSPELCALFDVPESMLPEVRNPADDYGVVEAVPALKGVPICGMAGDQQAALFGQACFDPGTVKNTYGTGCFLLMNTGERPIRSQHGLLTTLAADRSGGACYALEGAVFIAGAAVQWLRDALGLIRTAAESEQAALEAGDNGGVYLVPAFAGLGAPYWRPDVRGILTGLTRGAGRAHVVRAALESIAYQTADVLSAMEQDAGARITSLAVDGGAAANDFLMQFQADILACRVVRPVVIESTSLGAAWLAGLRAGVWPDARVIESMKRVDRVFEPAMSAEERNRLLAGWKRAVRQACAEV